MGAMTRMRMLVMGPRGRDVVATVEFAAELWWMVDDCFPTHCSLRPPLCILSTAVITSDYFGAFVVAE